MSQVYNSLDDDFAEVFKPFLAKVSQAIDNEIRENSEVSIYDTVNEGPRVAVSIPLGGRGDLGADVSLDDLMDECIEQIEGSPGDLRDWVDHMRRYLDKFEKALERAERG